LFEWDHAKELSVNLLSLIKFLTNALTSPCNPKELFNLHCASAHNVVKQIFGILKQQFQILQLPPEYDMSIQALIPPALAVLHNFIQHYDPEEIHIYDDKDMFDFQISAGPIRVLGQGPATSGEVCQANQRQDRIVDEMWAQYQRYLEDRAACNQ
jgi:hypothetical protein